MEQDADAPVGMAQIAASAGVAVSTVSRALSGAPGVSARKRAEILEIARRTGYLMGESNTATERRPRARGRIAAVIPEADRWVFGSILAGIQDVLNSAHTHLTVYQGSSAAHRAQIVGSAGLYRDADVAILVPLPHGLEASDLVRLRHRLVVAGSVVPGVPSAGIDDIAAGQKATNYLLNTGYRSLAFAAYQDHDGTRGQASRKRGDGFTSTMERAGLDPSWFVVVQYGQDAGQTAAQQFLEGERLPEAIVCATDEMAAGMMAVFQRAGVRIPDDVAIIGVDNHPVAELMGLTTIAQPAREQGQQAARMALTLLDGGPVPDPMVLSTRLIVRETTRRS